MLPNKRLSNKTHDFSLTQPYQNGQTTILMKIWCHICIHNPWKPPKRHLICQNWTRSRDYMTWKGAKLTEILKITFFARIRFYFFSFNEIQTPTWSSLWWHMSNPMHIFFGSDLSSGPLWEQPRFKEHFQSGIIILARKSNLSLNSSLSSNSSQIDIKNCLVRK